MPGAGLKAEAQLATGKLHIYIGQASFIRAMAPSIPDAVWEQPLEGQLQTFLLIDHDLFFFGFVDAIRPGAKEMLHTLKQQHELEPVMLTGDRMENAAYVAEELGIEHVFADLRPEDKLEKVADFSQSGGLIMVGDGVNDAPALARATVGISLGRVASATAVDASDVVLLSEDLSLLPWLKNKSLKTHSIVKQNLILALAVILFATTPALLGLVPLWAAVLLHEGGTVLVGLNSLRLLR